MTNAPTATTVSPMRRANHIWANSVWFLPLGLFALLFLLLPSIGLFIGSVTGGPHGVTLSYFGQLFQNQYLDAYKVSIELSATTAIVGAAAGVALAWAVVGGGLPGFLRPFFLTFSGVASNFAGIPLAFAFTASLGPVGLVTLFLSNHIGLNLYKHGFSLFGFTGLAITYLYFQIPLMVLLMVPALDHLKQWGEAASNLGANSWQFWWHIGLPILRLPLLGATLLLFGNSFGAYATAYALTSGMINLVPIVIGQELSGNVVFSPNLADALAVGMIVIMITVFAVYLITNRNEARWQR